MLMRRLKARLRNEGIRYILTSATLGGEGDDEQVAAFAENLCGSSFRSEDVIRRNARWSPVSVQTAFCPRNSIQASRG